MQEINDIRVEIEEGVQECRIWTPSSSCYEVKSGYSWLRRNHMLMGDGKFTWKWI